MSSIPPYLSVIVPAYNGGEFLHRCLDAIFASTYRSIEVIVVDDCSTDDSASISLEKGATVLTTGSRSGPALARNIAATTAKGDVLMFIDADVVIRPDTLERIAEHFQKEPEVSALFGSYDDEPAEKNFLSQYKNLQHHFVHQNSSKEATTFWSGLGAMRREVFVEFGGFDCKKFAVPSIEDIDLGFRLVRAGHRIFLDRNIQAKHLKKWELGSHLKTEIFRRALPWSRLIVENNGMVNDMNLKTSDRASAALVALAILSLAAVLWVPELIFVPLVCLVLIAVINRTILGFFAQKRGILFAALTFPWQLLYYFYSGVTFIFVWIVYSSPRIRGSHGNDPAGQAG